MTGMREQPTSPFLEDPASPNLQEDWDRRICSNRRCRRSITGGDFVLQVSTRHERWFCSVDCVIAGKEAHDAALNASAWRKDAHV
jgi:hypothetical protein